MKKYRVAFLDRENNTLAEKIIEANTSTEAFEKADRMPEADSRCRWISAVEIPDGPADFGIKYQYEDAYGHKTSFDHMVIRAESEAQAKAYYDANFKGKRCCLEDGQYIYGDVVETYIACCPGFHADATQME